MPMPMQARAKRPPRKKRTTLRARKSARTLFTTSEQRWAVKPLAMRQGALSLGPPSVRLRAMLAKGQRLALPQSQPMAGPVTTPSVADFY